MADFDLIQTDAQVQSILNDGQNMQGAGAQTTLTTESVLLKDVNGNYHKILKSSFTEAIRDTLAGLLVNNDKGTTISQIAAIASGDFGSITPANLASVLGADCLVYKGNTNSNQSVTSVKNGMYSALSFNTIRGLPQGSFGSGILIKGDRLILYFVRDAGNGNNLFYKTNWYNEGFFDNWYCVGSEQEFPPTT